MLETILILFAIAIDIWLFYYLYRLQRIGCKCALDWRRYYIMVFIVVSIAMFGVHLVDIPSMLSLSIFLSGFYFILSIINIVVVLTYVHDLEKQRCTCSEDLARTILKVIAIFNAVIYALSIILLIFAAAKLNSIMMHRGILSKQKTLFQKKK